MDSADYPLAMTDTGHTAPVPRRVRGTLGGRTVFDTDAARYVWEWPFYPQYYIPLDDVDASALTGEGRRESTPLGGVQRRDLRVGDVARDGAALVHDGDKDAALAAMVRFDWDALDAWYEEDEQIFVHPRNPYTRVDALRSTRHVRVELDGVLLAESSSPVLVFETGLPTRYYFNRTEVDLTRLATSGTVTSCPYKGTTSSYWSVVVGDRTYRDLAWSYDFPTRQLQPVTGLVAFLNEKVDIAVDGRSLPRPDTHFG